MSQHRRSLVFAMVFLTGSVLFVMSAPLGLALMIWACWSTARHPSRVRKVTETALAEHRRIYGW